jgi:phage terminase small subunit
VPWGRRFAALKGASSIGGAFYIAKKGGACCMANTLTPKQERFCLAYSATGNATRAYQEAYGEEDEKAAGANGARLIGNDRVSQRIEELRKETASPKILSIKERKEILTRIAQEGKACDSTRAIDLLNKMDNLYVQKQEIAGAIPVVLNDNVRE